MLVEISVAVNYILSHLYTKLPRRRVDSFGEELERYLQGKFQQHWFPAEPLRDSAIRCISATGAHVDILLPEAAAISGLDWSEIQACLPDGLVISIDPGHVSCQYNPPHYAVNELNKYNASSFWPSASVSLSSSGCSSASSSISSSNMTPNNTQQTHQVLYCTQGSLFANYGQQWTESQTVNNTFLKTTRSEAEHGDHLATAAALSVLVDNEDNSAYHLDQEVLQNVGESLVPKNLWNSDQVGINFQGVGFKETPEQSDKEAALGGIDQYRADNVEVGTSKLTTSSLNWPQPDGESDSSFQALFNNTELSAPYRLEITNERMHTVPSMNRSLSNPPQSDSLALPSVSDFVATSTTNINSLRLNPTFQPKYDQTISPTFGLNPVFPQNLPALNATSANHFVQKSVSTPSFTAATFAQTKFGSTKLKNHTKRTPNRILSPTTVQQTFASLNGSCFVPQEPLTTAGVGSTQRMLSGTSSDISAFRRFMPNTSEMSANHAAKPIHIIGGNYSPNDRPVSGLMESSQLAFIPGTINRTENKPFPFNLHQKMGGHFSPNNLDDLLPCTLEGANVEGAFGKFNFPNNASGFWSSAAKRPYHDSVESSITLNPDWAASGSLQQPLYASLSGLRPDGSALGTQMRKDTVRNVNLEVTDDKCEENGDLHDEALLSTRMVNLLLEEDGPMDPGNHEVRLLNGLSNEEMHSSENQREENIASDTAEESANNVSGVDSVRSDSGIFTSLGTL
ncbi:unnamed protein product [Calicophoron daubneyi]|uniref:Anti-proliferative protein domain-containing protein n=1 Tax=Calicophoron daubneyi TaxID=300641 RepID=A0AAV2TPD6_CALDB